MNNDLYGVLVYKDKKYHFVLDDRFVRIIGEPFQYINDFNDADEIDVIQGVTAGNRDIRFFALQIFQRLLWICCIIFHSRICYFKQ